MSNAAVKPFDYDDLTPLSDTAVVKDNAADEVSRTDVDAARQEGFEQGRAAANMEAAEAQTAALAAIENAISRAQAEFASMLNSERKALKAVAGEFLEIYCAQFSAINDLAFVNDLLDQLLRNSTDQQPARLLVSRQTYELSAKRIQTLVDARAANFITLVCDPSLDTGECRIDWRGGSISHDLGHVRKAIAKFIDAEKPHPSNPEQDS